MGIGSCVYLDEVQKGIVPRALTDIFTKKEVNSVIYNYGDLSNK